MIPEQLPDEVIMTEILSRTSLRTLDAIRCASKNVDSFTYESYFLNLYKQRNNIVSGFLVVEDTWRGHEYINQFVPSPKSNGLDLSILPHNTRILATSEQGLIVITSRDPSNCSKDLYLVCKPATKQRLLLPNPNSDYVTQKVAIVIMGFKPLNFKIIRLSIPLFYSQKQERVALFTTYYYEIFDSSTTLQVWTPPHRIRFPRDIYLENAQPITTRGSIYMLLTNADILKFDAYLHKWTFLSPPIPTLKHQCRYTSKQLVKYEGKLGFTCISPDNACLEMWVLDIDESWEKVNVASNKQKEDIAWKSFVALYDSDTSIMVDGHTLTLYNFKEGCSNTNYKVVLNAGCRRMFNFRSDFEPIDSMHPIEVD